MKAIAVVFVAAAAFVTGIEFIIEFVNMNTKRKDTEDIKKCLEDEDFWDIYNDVYDVYEVWK